MTTDCQPENFRGRTISSLFSAGIEILPGIRVRTCSPAEVNDVCISLVDLEELEAVFRTEQSLRSAADLLSPDEQTRFAAYTYPKRRREWLGGRLACKTCVLEQLRQPRVPGLFSSLSILPAEHGAPRVSASHALSGATGHLPSVSISHSGRYAVAMAADKRFCGVDIQRITSGTVRVADRFADPRERMLLREAMPDWDETQRLTLLWAAKEALKKALLSRQPVFFRGIILQTVRRADGITLGFTNPTGTGETAVAASDSLNDYMLAYSISPDTPCPSCLKLR
jgi:4'-phosphopantetheinyl transferase EntD